MKQMTKPRIYGVSFTSVYPLYIAKAEKKGRLQSEIDEIIYWLTGYDHLGCKLSYKNKQTVRHSSQKRHGSILCGNRLQA